MAMIIKTDGTQRKCDPVKGHKFSLDELRDIVGGNIEMVMIGTALCLIVNEEGKLLNLRFNMKATNLYRTFVPTTDYIVGDVLLCYTEQIN